MDLEIKNKVAIVTGASKGIGKAIANELAQQGCKLAINARNAQELGQTAHEISSHGTEVLHIPMDMTDEDSIENFVQQTKAAYGKVDILVNNAGTIGNLKPFEELSTQEWRDLFELNLFSVVTLTRLVIPMMREQQWGRVINISSENGEQPYPDMAHYSVSKGALNNFSKMLSKAYGKDNILVNTVSPAFIKTPLVVDMIKQQANEKGISEEEAEKQFLKENRPGMMLDRAGWPEETASIVAFLASDKASFITGSNYRVDAGSVMSI